MSTTPCSTIVGGRPCGEDGGGTGTISEITSADGTVVVVNPNGPITDLSAPDVGDLTGITSLDGSVTIVSPGGPVPDLSVPPPGASVGATVPTAASGATPLAGVSVEAARADHKHNLEVAIADEGVPDAPAHSFDFIGVGVVATTVAGVCGVRIDGAPVGNNPPATVAPDNVAGPGVSVGASREDHIHALPVANVGSTGTSNGAGTDNSVARSDHVHRTQVQVQKAGAIVGNRPKINFIEGANVTITTVDEGGSDRVNVTIAAAAAGGTVDIEDEGAPEGAADTIDFVGAGVSVGFAAGKATVTIPGGGGSPDLDFSQIVSIGTATVVAPAAWTDIPGTSVVINGAGSWLIMFSYGYDADTDAMEVRLVVDGVALAGSVREIDSTFDLVPQAVHEIAVGVLAGAKTIKAQVQRAGAFGDAEFINRTLSAVRIRT